MNPIHAPTSPGTFLETFKVGKRIGSAGGNRSTAGKGKERRPEMKTEQGNGDALTWSGICEISNEAKSLSAILPDAGSPSKTHLAHVDAVRRIFRVRCLIASIPETGYREPGGGNPFQPLAD
jgi:hypothetical protein